MVTDGKSNGNIVKRVVDPFRDGNGNGKNSTKYIHMQFFCCHHHCHTLRVNRSATKLEPSQCERALCVSYIESKSKNLPRGKGGGVKISRFLRMS